MTQNPSVRMSFYGWGVRDTYTEQDSDYNSSVTSRSQATIAHPWCASPLPWRQFKVSRVSPEKEKREKETVVKTVKMLSWHTYETTVSMVPTPRSYATTPHAPAYRVQSSSQTLLTPTMTCWKSRRSCSSRGLPRKQAQDGLSNAEWR
jgi:hypothetical protein